MTPTQVAPVAQIGVLYARKLRPRMAEAGEIIKVKKGLYTTTGAPPVSAVSHVSQAPSTEED